MEGSAFSKSAMIFFWCCFCYYQCCNIPLADAWQGPTIRPAQSHRARTWRLSLRATPGRRLDLLSFDLDDTLFPTSPVVRSANEAMISTMGHYGCTDTSIPKFLNNTRSIRKGLTEPITYRDLRKATIRKTLMESKVFLSSSVTKGDIDGIVETCYESWVKERHFAAEQYIFEDAIDTLQSLREMYPETCIVAITNGAGDPLEMTNTLAPYFDMRVSGEDDEVFPHRKPHPFIYEYTLQQCEKVLVDAGESLVWCHIGDCLANDVRASAACGAKAIWLCADEDEELAASRLVDTRSVPEWSTASSEELQKRAQQIQSGKDAISAKIRSLAELPTAIETILLQQVE